MVDFRDYQDNIIDQGCDIIGRYGFLYLAMEVRTGKTLTSLGIAQRMRVNDVVFVTKKKAISSIQRDYDLLGAVFNLTVINYESLHKLDVSACDLVVVDEAHSLGKYAKPSLRAKQIKALVGRFKPIVILLSGTPTPESYSQMYHQVYGIPNNPFKEYKNFYRFSDDHINVTQKKINGQYINNYDDAKASVREAMARYTISFTQAEAGFSTEVKEEIIYIPIKQKTYDLCNILKKNLVIEGKNEVILADTGAKLMSKLHQMYSGTVKFESGLSMVLDRSKAEYIKERFSNNKLGIFYKFKAELDALRLVFGDKICTDLETFDSTDKHIALQIVSGREGISLRNADFIVFYNIDFSATSYWQARDRMTTMDRKFNKVFWIFSEKGIEKSIYKTVINKKDFTLKHYERTRFD